MKSNKIKNILKYILAFLIPVAIILIYLLYKELTTGKYIMKFENFLLADASSQYNSIYSYIWDVLRGNESVFYSFGKSLGGNMASTIGYYASSPLNFLYLIGGKENVPTITFILYLIKVGLSSLFMYMFLNYKIKKENNNIIFSVMYALCSYMAVYYFNNMWLDIVALTPLVLLGLDKLINENKISLYSITLGVAIFANFYIAYMLCIFCAIYFIYQILLKYNLKEFSKYKKIIFKFIIASLLGVGLSCILLIPAILNLNQILRAKSSVSGIDFSNISKYIFDDFFAKLYIGSHNTNTWLNRNQANLYCGILPIILNFFYYFNPKIKKKERLLSFGVLLVLIISILEPHINYIWHGFSIPNGYIGRFSFLFSFYILYIAAIGYKKLEKIKPFKIIIFTASFVLINFVIIDRTSSSIDFMNNYSIVLTSAFFFAYLFGIIATINIKDKIIKKMIRLAFYFLVIIELFINYSMCFITNKDKESFGSPSNYYNKVCPVIRNLDSGFYRIDGPYGYSLLEPFICNTMGIGSSLSTNDGKLYGFIKNHGGSITYTTIFYDLDKLPILDTVLGIKYVKVGVPRHTKYLDEYKRILLKNDENDSSIITIYKNPYALSLGYLIPKNSVEIYNNGNHSNSFESLNTLMKALSGVDENILIPYKQKYLKDAEYLVYIDKYASEIYLSFDYNIYTNVDNYFRIYVNDSYVGSGYSEDIGTYKISNTMQDNTLKIKLVNVDKKNKIIKSLVAYHFDEKAFKKQVDKLKKSQLKNIKIKENKVSGNIDVQNDSTLFLSIPYDKGWKVYVDGKKVKYKKVVDEFIGVDLDKGKHKIEMKYISPGFVLGLLVTIISSILIIGDLVYKSFKTKYKKN